MNPKICICCQREIRDEENYIQLIEWDAGKQRKENFCHKICWLNMMDTKRGIKEGLGLLNSLRRFAQQKGMIPEEEVKV